METFETIEDQLTKNDTDMIDRRNEVKKFDMLKNKNAIITGARRGIGRATVEVFASKGANVWACARKQNDSFEEDMSEIAEKYKVSIWPLYFDLTNEMEMKSAVQTIRKHKVNVDVLVNVAGITEESTSFQMTSMDKMHHVLEVNFFAVSMFTQYISRLMTRQNSGSIINIASIAGIDGTPAQYEYAASKAAIIGATKNLAREIAPFHVRVNAVAPGIITTDMGDQINDELRQRVMTRIMMGREGTPKEVADVIAFLASDMSSYMTGQVIRVDGGI